MTTTPKSNILSRGTALILLRETSTQEEFREYLNSLGMTYAEAFIEMNKARELNITIYYPQKKRKLLTLRKTG